MVMIDSVFKNLRPLVRGLYHLRGTGLPRLAEAFRGYVARNWSDHEVIIDDFMGHLRCICQLGEHMGSQIFWRGAYSGGQLAVLKTLLKPSDVFVDIGANQGEFTLLASFLIGSAGRVFAFEPVPSSRSHLQANISLNNFTNIVIEPYAIADIAGMILLYSSAAVYRDGSVHDGLPSLFRTEGRDQAVAEAEVMTLDAWRVKRGVAQVNVIKLDIEGAELHALRGGEKLIEDCRPVLIMEFNESTANSAGYALVDLAAWLHAKGYKLESIADSGQRVPISANAQLAPFQNVLAVPSK